MGREAKMFSMNGDPVPPMESVLVEIRRRDDQVDLSAEWPQDCLRTLSDAGVLQIALPAPIGPDLSALAQHLVYEQVARASLGVSLILSQRDAAIGLIAASPASCKHSLLTELARGAFTTVGVAQLTTSRQGAVPALRATRDRDGYRIDGLIPWCTGAAKAEFIVAGAAADDGRQLLFVLWPKSVGVKIDPPLPLVALRSTWTTSVHCDGLRIGPSDILSGPADKVLVRNNNLPLGQAFLAMGLCQGAIDLIAEHRSSAASTALESFDSQLKELRQRIIDLSEPGRETEAIAIASEIRGHCNDLAVRITHAAVALYKGTALLAGHPAHRLAREAMFLLVWSCPNPVIDCTVEMLSRC